MQKKPFFWHLTMLLLAAILLLALLLFLLLLQSLFRLVSRKKERVVGFFHPFTNDGGGGERVLWCAVRAVQEMAPDLPIAIYTGDPATPESLALRALDRFGVKLLQPIRVSRVYTPVVSHFSLPFSNVGLCSCVLGTSDQIRDKVWCTWRRRNAWVTMW